MDSLNYEIKRNRRAKTALIFVILGFLCIALMFYSIANDGLKTINFPFSKINTIKPLLIFWGLLVICELITVFDLVYATGSVFISVLAAIIPIALQVLLFYFGEKIGIKGHKAFYMTVFYMQIGVNVISAIATPFCMVSARKALNAAKESYYEDGKNQSAYN